MLEGGDQYRGWFRSSLITGVAIKGRAPYRRVMKNGWVNDEQGRPMSKSRGTGIDARERWSSWGADVLRLWTASVEFVDDVRFGPNVVEQVGRVYRNLRNRIRFMLSNLDDLDAAGLVARDAMQPIDRLACARRRRIRRRRQRARTSASRFTTRTCASSSSRARCRASTSTRSRIRSTRERPRDPRRRSAQSALLYVLTRFLTALAPVLSFTTEEAWQSLPAALRGEAESVFDTSFNVSAPPQRGRSTASSRCGKQLRDAARSRRGQRERRATSKRKLRLACARRSYRRLARARRQPARSARRLAA